MGVLIKFRKSVMAFIKLLSVVSVTCLFVHVWQNYYSESLYSYKGNFVVVFCYLVILVAFTVLYSGFSIGVLRLHEVIYSGCLSLFFTNFITYFILCLIARMLLMPWALLVLTLVQFLLLAVCDYAANTIYFKLYKARHILVVFNDDEKSRNIINKMRLIKERFVIEKGVTTNRSIEEIEAEIDRFETVLICDIDKVIKNEILRYCYAEKKRVYLLPSVIDILVNNGDQVQIFDTPVIICRNRGLRVEQRILKRCMDLFISVVSLLALSPLMLITALSIKLCDGGPVFFKQNRVTYNGKIFNILKFRSMIVDADKDGAKKAVNNDCRITPVGRIIRRYRIDELPQLINVLFGTMSIVGPRPERTENVHEYTEQLPEFPLRHRVKAGLTGYAQIYGKYNTSPADKLNMDLIYIEKYSIFSDIKLLIMTIKILFVKESTEGFGEQSNSNVKKTSKKRVSE